MSESLPNSRFQLLDKPIRNPGSCCVCGSSNRPVVDFGANLHQLNSVWTLYICVLCIKDAANVVDILTGEKEKREAEATHSLKEQLNKQGMVAIPREYLNVLISISTEYGAVVDSIVDLDLEAAQDSESNDDSESPNLFEEFDGDDTESSKSISTTTF